MNIIHPGIISFLCDYFLTGNNSVVDASLPWAVQRSGALWWRRRITPLRAPSREMWPTLRVQGSAIIFPALFPRPVAEQIPMGQFRDPGVCLQMGVDTGPNWPPVAVSGEVEESSDGEVCPVAIETSIFERSTPEERL